MTVLDKVDLKCPVCEKEFSSTTVTSTNSFGGKRTDFHERSAGTQPHAYMIHQCPRCGVAGNKNLLKEFEGQVTFAMKEQIWEQVAPRVQNSPSGSEKYEAAAISGRILGLDARYIADQYLYAAYCCVDEGDVEAERYFRLRAAWRFEEALGEFGLIEDKERAILTYLVGELWRRIGDPHEARKWFNKVKREIVDLPDQQWVIDAAKQQRDNPREWFG